jgi:hypothetical protein
MNNPLVQQLAEADQALQQVLANLDQRTGSHFAPADIQTLTAAVQQYQQAVTASLPPTPVDVLSLTPEQLLAYRETDPVYRLGWVRGHKAGLAQAHQTSVPVLSLYAQHAALPPPTDPTELMQQVCRFLALLQQRYNTKGPIPHR